MKKQLLICSIIFLALTGFGQKKIVHVASRQNNSCNGDCTLLNIGELDGNPSAIIWATPLAENGVNTNPHPIGVYYFKNKWSIFNLDQKPIPEGSKFTVEYVTRPDDTHFQYVLNEENLQKDGSAFIDHPAMNNNPSVKFNYFLSWNPDVQRGITNRDATTILYNREAGKWVMSSTNNKPLSARVAYNIVLASPKNGTVTASNALEIKELIIAPTGQSISEPLVGMYMGIEINGTQLPGDNPAVLTADKTRLYSFEMGAAKPPPNTKIKKTYEPTTIRIRTGVPATIPLFNAFVNSQPVILTIDTYSNNTGNGKTELNYTIKLSGVSVLGFKQVFEDPSLQKNVGAIAKIYDEIKITFTKIEYIKEGATVEDVL